MDNGLFALCLLALALCSQTTDNNTRGSHLHCSFALIPLPLTIMSATKLISELQEEFDRVGGSTSTVNSFLSRWQEAQALLTDATLDPKLARAFRQLKQDVERIEMLLHTSAAHQSLQGGPPGRCRFCLSPAPSIFRGLTSIQSPTPSSSPIFAIPFLQSELWSFSPNSRFALSPSSKLGSVGSSANWATE